MSDMPLTTATSMIATRRDIRPKPIGVLDSRVALLWISLEQHNDRSRRDPDSQCLGHGCQFCVVREAGLEGAVALGRPDGIRRRWLRSVRDLHVSGRTR